MALFLTSFSNLASAREMRRILLSTIKILISAALLYFSLRKANFSELASRLNIASLGWIGLAIAVTFFQIFVGVLRWREISAECGAPLAIRQAMRFNLIGAFFNQTLPSSIGVMRCGFGWSRAPARDGARDLFHFRRPRHWPDCTCHHHRREPAVELPPDRRSRGPDRAIGGRFRLTRRRPRVSHSRRLQWPWLMRLWGCIIFTPAP